MTTPLTFGFTVAYWCVLIAALLPIVCAGLAKWHGFGRPRREGGYDNVEPRAWLARQDGWRARAGETDGPRAALTVADYIAGMTDRFALDEHRRLTDPFTIG